MIENRIKSVGLTINVETIKILTVHEMNGELNCYSWGLISELKDCMTSENSHQGFTIFVNKRMFIKQIV